MTQGSNARPIGLNLKPMHLAQQPTTNISQPQPPASRWGPPITIGIETVSLAGPIYEKLKKEGTVGRLEAMARDVEREMARMRGGSENEGGVP